MYAQRKSIKLKSVNVKVEIVNEGEVSQIRREISFEGDLTEADRATLMQVADKCPVHKLLSHPIKIETLKA